VLSPAWLKNTEHAVAPLVMVKVAPLLLQPPPDPKVTVKPELAVAATVKVLP
jgi:hypothetical protein